MEGSLLQLFIGFVGMSLILLAFIMNVFYKKVTSSSRIYLILNFVGSVSLVVYAVMLGSMPFAILNSVWAIAAAWGILHHR